MTSNQPIQPIVSTATPPGRSTTAAQLLVVEDESSVAALLATTLRLAGYEVTIAQNAAQALSALAKKKFDAVLVDWMLPTTTGIELIRTLRQQATHRLLPIMMLTAKSQENDTVIGLEAGADDYLSKPFSPRELVARVKALLRRAQPLRDESLITVAPITLNPTQGSVHFSDVQGSLRPVVLSHTEFKLLQCLMLQAQRVHSRENLLEKAWDHAAQVDVRTIDAHIKRLRQALALAGCDNFIHTVRGMGYTLNATL
jgi:two-component system, OmpR family, phosphate regulon response regulator PhoB